MSEIAPVILLFNEPVDLLTQALAEFVGNSETVVEYEANAASHGQRRLLFGGIELLVSLCDPPDNSEEYRQIFLATDPSKFTSAVAIVLGENVAGGARVAPIVQSLLQFAAAMALNIGAVGVAWTPALLLTDPHYFAESVESYVDGGVFPVLSTVDLQLIDIGLQTKGLSWLSGQEVTLVGESLSHSDLMRRAVRIVHDIAVNGPVLTEQVVLDIENETRALLTPSDDGSIILINIQTDNELSV